MISIWIVVQKMVLAAIPAVGFALLFNVPRHALRYCAILGALGYGCRTILIMSTWATPVAANFWSAALIGFVGIGVGQQYRAHPKVFTVSALIPMIPGVYAYRAMISLLEIQKYGFSETRFTSLMDNFVQAGFLVAALVFGLALPGLLFYRHRPVV